MTFKKPLGPNGAVITMASGKAGREQNPLGLEILMRFLTIWRYLVDLGSHLGAHWILRGSQNWPSKKQKTCKKWSPRNGLVKTWFVDLFLMPKREAWNCKKEVPGLDMLQNISFLGVVNIEKFDAKRVPQNYQNRSLWWHRVGILGVWSFLRKKKYSFFFICPPKVPQIKKMKKNSA